MGQKDSQTIGEAFAKRREEIGLSVKDAADAIQAPQKFIEAFERNDYKVFPARIYALGFFKKYVKLLKMESADDDIMRWFNQEWEVAFFNKDKDIKKLPELKEKLFVITPQRVAAAFIAVFMLIVGGYFYYELAFLGAPMLKIEAPSDDFITPDNFIEIKGKTESGADLTINGRPLYIGENGDFKDTINLAAGLNTLEFKAVSKNGKETKVIRRIFVK
jgi:hypothetical protein